MEFTLVNMGIFLGIIAATALIAFIFNRFFNKFIKSRTDELHNDPTNYKFLRHFLSAIIYMVGLSLAIYSVPNLRTLAGGILAGAGIIAVAIGFASQHALSNIISGVFIVLFKPFRINDRLTIGTRQGVVEDITLRHTVIRDFENRRIVIPNSVISNEVLVNADLEDERVCKHVEIGITYDSSIDLAKKIMAEEVALHPLSLDIRSPEQIAEGVPEVIVRVLRLDNSAVVLRAWAWARDSADGFVLNCDLLESIKKRFDHEGVSIAFPHQVVILKQHVQVEPVDPPVVFHEVV